MTQETHYGHTVTALFGSKFSKSLLPGASHQDMEEMHDAQAEHHASIAAKANQNFMKSDDPKERRSFKEEAYKHHNLAQKHQKLAAFHEAQGKNTRIPRSAQNHNGNFGNPISHGLGNIAHGVSNTMKHVLPHLNPVGNPITHHVAKLWHSFAPKIKHLFSMKRPNSPIVRSHLRNEPKMPMPPKVLHDSNIAQARFHQNEAVKAERAAMNTEDPVKKQAAYKTFKEHKDLASNHQNMAQIAKKEQENENPVSEPTNKMPFKPTSVVPPKPKATTKPKTVPVIKPRKDVTPAVKPMVKSAPKTKIVAPPKPKVIAPSKPKALTKIQNRAPTQAPRPIKTVTPKANPNKKVVKTVVKKAVKKPTNPKVRPINPRNV